MDFCVRKDSDDWIKTGVSDCRRIILQLVLIVLWAFFEMLALGVEFRVTFHGFGDPSGALTEREYFIITIMHFLPFSIMVATLMSIGLVWLFATNFPDIRSGVMDIILDFINILRTRGKRNGN